MLSMLDMVVRMLALELFLFQQTQMIAIRQSNLPRRQRERNTTYRLAKPNALYSPAIYEAGPIVNIALLTVRHSHCLLSQCRNDRRVSRRVLKQDKDLSLMIESSLARLLSVVRSFVENKAKLRQRSVGHAGSRRDRSNTARVAAEGLAACRRFVLEKAYFTSLSATLL